MVTIQALQNGAVKYIDRELLPQMVGWKRWAFGAAASLWLSNLPNTYNQLRKNPFVNSLGVLSENGQIDIDKIYREFAKQAEQCPITVSLPVVGEFTINKADVELLYRLILEG